MRNIKKIQVAVIQANTAEELQGKMNEVLDIAKDPVVEVDLKDLRACITYSIDQMIAETPYDEASLSGCTKQCKDCPHCIKSADNRKKAECELHGWKMWPERSACDEFYVLQERRKGGRWEHSHLRVPGTT